MQFNNVILCWGRYNCTKSEYPGVVITLPAVYTTLYGVVASASPNNSSVGVSGPSVLALSGANSVVNMSSFKLSVHDHGGLYKWISIGY